MYCSLRSFSSFSNYPVQHLHIISVCWESLHEALHALEGITLLIWAFQEKKFLGLQEHLMLHIIHSSVVVQQLLLYLSYEIMEQQQIVQYLVGCRPQDAWSSGPQLAPSTIPNLVIQLQVHPPSGYHHHSRALICFWLVPHTAIESICNAQVTLVIITLSYTIYGCSSSTAIFAHFSRVT